jgi:very-short-patch-repair endonuclease
MEYHFFLLVEPDMSQDHRNKEEWVNQRFLNFVVIDKVGEKTRVAKGYTSQYDILLVKCDCGHEHEITATSLLRTRLPLCRSCSAKSKPTKRKKTSSTLRAEQYLTKENLEKYLPLHSANYIAKKLFYPDFTTHAGEVIRYAKKFGIQTHSISDSKKLKTVSDQYKKTVIERFGCENVSQSKEVKDKKVNSALAKYGCVNVFQSEEIKEKARQTNLDKYGFEHACQRPGGRKGDGKTSKIHRAVSTFLFEKKLLHENESAIFSKYCETKQRIYSPIADIRLMDHKICVEVNGDKWHANPRLYKPTDLINTWRGDISAEDIWLKDSIKRSHIESFGYVILYVWELDLNTNKPETLSRLYDEICKNIKDSQNL